MTVAIVVFPPTAGGNHLRNLISLSRNYSDNFDDLIYQQKNTVHAYPGRNLKKEQFTNILIGNNDHLLHGHFGEIMSYQHQIREIENKKNFDFAFNASDFLVLNSGIPNNWQDLNINSIYQIGLAKSNNELDKNKLLKFIDLNSQYSLVKDKLGLSQYDFYISFVNGQSSNTLYEFGINPTNNSAVTIITRYATLDSNIIKINLKVWK